jgi:hypothetical protein
MTAIITWIGTTIGTGTGITGVGDMRGSGEENSHGRQLFWKSAAQGLEWARVYFKQQVSLFHLVPLDIILRKQVARNLCADLSVNLAIQRSNPFLVHRDGLRLDRHHLNHGR